MRERFLPFAKPDLDRTELVQIEEAIESGWVTTGPKTREFEEEFAAAVGARHAVAVNSATAAMHLGLEASDVKRGDEVITTAYTFAATAEVVRYFDAVPILVDVDPLSLNMRADLVEDAITDRTKAILPVHLAGLPADLDAIYAVAAAHGLAVVEDAAHAFPARHKNHMVGADLDSGRALTAPHLTCFSFYATKTITTGEGGMITTSDEALADRCRVMALHGISKHAWKRYTAEGSWYYEIIAPGFKYNMTDIAAGMGLAQLAKADRMWMRRREIAGRYNEAFRSVREIQIPHDREDCQHAWHLYMLRINAERLKINRGEFVQKLKERNIGTSVHFIPLHLHPYYRETYGYKPDDFPVSEREYRREISLPIYSRMSDSDVQDVIEAVLSVVEDHKV